MPFLAATRSLGRAGLFSLSVFRASKPTSDFFAELTREIYKIGGRSLPIIAVGGAFVGLVLTLQGYRTLTTFGAADALSTLLGLSLYRELGPVLTALLFIGRAGSSIAAELGLMRATDQIKALELMAIDPVAKAVAPRFWAAVLTVPLLEGTDGVQKMSKSLGNYIGINEPPNAIFGKTMSISDELMWRYYELLSWEASLADIARMRADVAARQANPRDFKLALARELVARFHDRAAAEEAIRYWNDTVRAGQLPTDIEEHAIAAPAGGLRVAALLKAAGLVPSTSEAQRLLAQRGVRIDGEVVEDRERTFSAGQELLLQVGKRRFARVRLLES